MDFFTIIIQFITVLFASILGPIGLNWFKNKNKIEVQRKKNSLKTLSAVTRLLLYLSEIY